VATVRRIDPDHPEDSLVALAVDEFRKGGLVAFPTETVYGIGARALDTHALARIFAAKGRPANHPVIAHVLDERGARELAQDLSPSAVAFARAFWPGPLTLVVPRAAHVPALLSGGTDTIGIRAPRHNIARALIRALGEPIAAPSANRYQALSPTRVEHVVSSLGDRVDLILDGGPCQAGIESTVLDVTGEVPLVLRPGTVDLMALRSIDPRVVARGDAPVADGAGRASPGLDARHYAPLAPLCLARSRDDAVREALVRVGRGERVGVLLVGDGRDARTVAFPPALGPVANGVLLAHLPRDPWAYARDLYAVLHSFETRVDSIVVQAVPEEEPWRAIRDRLARASSPRSAREATRGRPGVVDDIERKGVT
jgi:L-threonylcarbamoyladenylate synthase